MSFMRIFHASKLASSYITPSNVIENKPAACFVSLIKEK